MEEGLSQQVWLGGDWIEQPLLLPVILNFRPSQEAQWERKQTSFSGRRWRGCAVLDIQSIGTQGPGTTPVGTPGGLCVYRFQSFIHSFSQQIIHLPYILPQALHQSQDIKVKKTDSLITNWKRRHTMVVHCDPSVAGAVAATWTGEVGGLGEERKVQGKHPRACSI